MCWADVEIDRERASAPYFRTIDNAVQPLFGSSRKRIGIILAGVSAGTVTIWVGNTVTALQGIVIRSTDRPIVIDIEKWGDIVTKPWSAIADAAGRVLSVVEVMLPEVKP